MIEQEYLIKIRITHKEIFTKMIGFVNSKLKAKDIWKLFFDIKRLLFTMTTIEFRKKKILTAERF